MKTLPKHKAAHAVRSMARVADVARFLGVEPKDVRRMVRLDALPAVKVPGPTKPMLRFPLRSLHAWLAARELNGGVSKVAFEAWLVDFHQAAAVRGTAEIGGEEGDAA